MPASPLGQPLHHESAVRHVTGAARYVDDLPEPRDLLVAALVCSPHARARIRARDADAARAMPGIAAVLFADAIPGHNGIGPVAHDEPILAEDEVYYRGQPVAIVLGDSYAACRDAAAQVQVDYEPLTPLLGIEAAVAAGSFLGTPHVIARGDVEAALAAAPVRVDAEVSTGAQDHFYLETHASMALPGEDGTMHVYSSTQHPTEVQKMVALVLGRGNHEVVCQVPRMGGGFGGKESQSSNFACLAALGAHHTGRPVKVWLNRDDDMTITGKRHPFHTRYRAGFDPEGRLLAFDVKIYSDGGWVTDLSQAIFDRALFHLDNAYYIPALRFEGRACRTNVVSHTAFRGFGGPQGMVVVEDALSRAAERLGLDTAEIRKRNYYGGAPRDRTPYDQEVKENRLHRIHEALLRSSDHDARRDEIASFNAGSRWVKRGLAFQPVKFGISFTATLLNQAGALVLVYADGTVQVNHGGTEMGQGLHTKMLAIAAHALGVPLQRIRLMDTATDKVPNTSATAASSGADLNGQAVRAACEAIRERMRPVAAELLGLAPPDAGRVKFEDGRCRAGDASVPFADVAKLCWVKQISLSSTGFYRTPGIHYDASKGRGTPFYYFAYGAAVVEVELNGLTGEHRLRRVDILHDVGDSLVPSIDRGQVEGAFIQGYGWLTCEEVLFDGTGRLLTTGPSTYKIPAVGECPRDFRVHLLDRAPQPGTIHGSKAVGEPPFMLGIGAVTALRQAVAAFGPERVEVELALPATPEALLRAVEHARAASALRDAAK